MLFVWLSLWSFLWGRIEVVVMCLGQVANQTEVLKQVVAEHYLKEKRGGKECALHKHYLCRVGTISTLLLTCSLR